MLLICTYFYKKQELFLQNFNVNLNYEREKNEIKI